MPWHQLHLSHRGQMEKLLMENMSSSLASQCRELSSKQVVSLIRGMIHSGCAEGQDVARELPAPLTFRFPKPEGCVIILFASTQSNRHFSYVHIWVSTFPLQKRGHFWNELKPEVLLFLAYCGKLQFLWRNAVTPKRPGKLRWCQFLFGACFWLVCLFVLFLVFSIWTDWINWKLTDLKIKADHWHRKIQSWPSNKQPGTGSYKLLGSFKTMQLDQTEQSMPFFEPAAVMAGNLLLPRAIPLIWKQKRLHPLGKILFNLAGAAAEPHTYRQLGRALLQGSAFKPLLEHIWATPTPVSMSYSKHMVPLLISRGSTARKQKVLPLPPEHYIPHNQGTERRQITIVFTWNH